jgi:xanthine dehydrogenase accessory factor
MLTAKDVHALLAAADSDAGLFVPRAALATLVRTVGSSLRRAGSRMLIGGNGHVVRAFGGGCPESDLILRARRVIASGHAENAVYDRENGLDLLIEMGCGGELQIMLEPVAQRSSLRFLDVIDELWRARAAATMATILAGDTERANTRLIWRGAETLLDEIGDPARRAAIIAAANSIHAAAAWRRLVVGGVDTDVLYEPITPPIQLILIGTNVVADAVACAAQELAWPVVRIDASTTTPQEFARLYTMGNASTRCDGNTFVLCMNSQFERDVEFAAAALATVVPYVGILGSHKRAAQMRQRLHERCGGGARERLYTPAGLSIGSEDAEQIAVSLIAEIMAVAMSKSGVPLSRSSESIHSGTSGADGESSR